MSLAAKAIDVMDELSRAVESGDVEALARLLRRGVNINARNRHGTTVLMRAARCGHAQIVRLLLEYGADPNLTRNDKFTALALAAFFGHTETVKTLMEFGARTEAVTRSGASAQTWATARTFAEVARCLDTPAPKPMPSVPRVQLQRNFSRRRFLALSVIATFVVIVCCAFGALVLNKSEAHDLPSAPLPPPAPKVETKVVNPEPPRPAPAPVVSEAPAESRAANLVRPTLKKAPAVPRAVKSLPVLSEKPAEEANVSAPPVVAKPAAKPKFEPPRPIALSPQIMAPTKKAKVIQWP